MDGVEGRLGRVEDKLDRMNETLARIEGRLEGVASKGDVEGVKASLPTYASATDMAFVKGRVQRLPTMGSLSALLVIAAGLWAFMPKLQSWANTAQWPF